MPHTLKNDCERTATQNVCFESEAAGDNLSLSANSFLYDSNRAVCKNTGQENIRSKQHVNFIAFPHTVKDHSTCLDIEAALIDGWLAHLRRNKMSDDNYEIYTYEKEYDSDNSVKQFP